MHSWESMRHIRQALKWKLDTSGDTVRDISYQLRISKQTIERIIRGHAEGANLQTILDLVDYIGLPTDFILFGRVVPQHNETCIVQWGKWICTLNCKLRIMESIVNHERK